MTEYAPPVPGLLVSALVLAAVCAVECWIFVLMYRKVEKTREGQHLYRLSIILGMTYTLTVGFALMSREYGWVLVAAIVQLLVFMAAVAELWVRIMLLVDNRREIRFTKTTTTEDHESDD